jgi:hypothetical protein
LCAGIRAGINVVWWESVLSPRKRKKEMLAASITHSHTHIGNVDDPVFKGFLSRMQARFAVEYKIDRWE